MPLSTRNVLNAVNSASNNSAHTRTVSYTVGASTELLVVIARISAGEIWATNLTAVRWADSAGNGDEALTGAVERGSAGGSGARTEIWYLANPTARAGRLEFDYTVTASNIQATSWTVIEGIGGVDTAAPLGATASAVGTTTGASLNLTSTVDGLLILSGLAHADNLAEPYTPGSGITAELGDGQTGTTAGNDHSYWAGECLTTTVGTYAVGATGTGSNSNFAVAAIEVLPATGGAGASFPFRPPMSGFIHMLVR
jgi:hypothetical protein